MPTDHDLRAMTDQIVAAYRSNPDHLPLSDSDVRDLARIVRDALMTCGAETDVTVSAQVRCGHAL